MRVAILYNEPGREASAADFDVIDQVTAVKAALVNLGHDPCSIGCDLDFEKLRESLLAVRPDCVFNLVEALGGTDRLATLVPVLLESMGIPYTGCPAATMLATFDKVIVKERIAALGFLTPEWWPRSSVETFVPAKYIIKARCEHASIGMDDSAVVSVLDETHLLRLVSKREERYGVPMFAERFVDGREFNVSVLGVPGSGGRSLAPAEIDFSAFPETKPRIVGFDAKWAEASFEYNATPRVFDFPKSDNNLLSRLRTISEAIWFSFDLDGYARVDFRISDTEEPSVLEINTNPCLSSDAGFAAALKEEGISFERAVGQIVDRAISRSQWNRGQKRPCAHLK